LTVFFSVILLDFVTLFNLNIVKHNHMKFWTHYYPSNPSENETRFQLLDTYYWLKFGGTRWQLLFRKKRFITFMKGEAQMVG